MQLQVTAATVGLRSKPSWDVPLETELLFGERFIFEEEERGWIRGRTVLDGYQGYVLRSSIVKEELIAPTHRIVAREAISYDKPDCKSHPKLWLPHGALCAARTSIQEFTYVAGAGYVFTAHLAPLATPVVDWVAEAEKYLGASYLWGGRTASRGVDCSGLVQNALVASGCKAPRNSGDQEGALGTVVRNGSALMRGDLVFWKGHVGIMLDSERLLHATASSMSVVCEPFQTVVDRQRENEKHVTSIKRLT
jgi:hypothetical protein